MMKKPIIGITPDYSYEKTRFKISEDYTNALLKAGGIPVLLFPGDDFPDFGDGISLLAAEILTPCALGKNPFARMDRFRPCGTNMNFPSAKKP